MNKTKIQWRKSPHTDDLTDNEKCKFYSYRHHIVRAVQKQNQIAMSKNKDLASSGLQGKEGSHNSLLELNEIEMDKLAREAYDSEMMPILHDGQILLTKAPVVADVPN